MKNTSELVLVKLKPPQSEDCGSGAFVDLDYEMKPDGSVLPPGKDADMAKAPENRKASFLHAVDETTS